MPGNLYLQHLSAGLHLAGANGATSFPDVKGHSFYRTGAVAISTAQNRFAGEGSAYFPGGVNDLIKCDAHADFGAATNNFALSWSMYPIELPPSGVTLRLIIVGLNGSTGTLTASITSTGVIYVGIAAGGTTATGSAAGAVVVGEWQDFEISAFNGDVAITRNRSLIAASSGTSMPAGGFPKRLQIGGDDSGFASVDARYKGYLSEVQIQMNHGRHPLAEAPTGPFLETLGIGVAAAVPAPVPAIRSTISAHRILRQGAPAMLLDTEHGGRGQIVGTTYNVGTPNYPVSRRVRLFRKRDGVMAREVWSDTAGNYEFRKIRHDIKYTVTGHDHTGLYNAEVSDSLVPEVV